MQILHISQSDTAGGAAIAAQRLVVAQRAAGLDAQMLVVDKSGSENFVAEAGDAGFRAKIRVARMVAWRIARLSAATDPKGMRSLGLMPSGLGRTIVEKRPDIVHWHWIGKESVSLVEMSSIDIPAVWTCHDQWAFCGAEHYAPDRRFTDGYKKAGILDIDALNFRRKQRSWADWHPTVICPSEWMAHEARASVLMGGNDIAVIPNTIDTAVFAPQPKVAAREQLGLPKNALIVLFGADNGVVDPRKGFDLLIAALEKIPADVKPDMMLATFGGSARTEGIMAGFRHIELGRQDQPENLATVYSASDVFVAPSRQDNLPNTVVEAQACGTPCVAFAIGGMVDIINRPELGTLVRPFHEEELAAAIQRVASMPRDRATIHHEAEIRFGQAVVVAKHYAIYDNLLEGRGVTA